MTWHEKLETLITSLERERDELRVQMNLASKDAKDEFAALEVRLDALRARLTSAGADMKDTAGELGDTVGDTARKVADELRAGYRKIRDTLSD
jgi:hypothetical protein